MKGPHRILVVDDTAQNVRLLADILAARDYAVSTAASGREALEQLDKEMPDLVLLDVVMPEMSGYEVCRRIRENPVSRMVPVVLVTALDLDEERIKGIEAGADDFLPKPIRVTELLARVRSLLRIRDLHEQVRGHVVELARLNDTLEQRVAEQVMQIRSLERLKRFFSPQIADLIAGNRDELLKPHRRNVVVLFADLRGFTAFAQGAEPEDVMHVLREYHGVMGGLITEYGATLERFAGDGLMAFFNDPIEVPNPEERAVRMAIDMQAAASELLPRWLRLGHELGLGIGIANGYAMLGVIGFEHRWDYAAIGTVTNVAARLCAAANHGQILISDRLLATLGEFIESESVGELSLKGIRRPLATHNVLRLKSG
jgi:adenylate cyclase